MLRQEVSNVSDISTLGWIKPSEFVAHSKLDGDFSHMIIEGSKDSIDLDRASYSDDEKMLVLYLQSAISMVERYLPFDLIEKDYVNFFDPSLKVDVRGRVKTLTSVFVNDQDVTANSKLVDTMIFIKEITDFGDVDGGSYLKVSHTVKSVEDIPFDIKQAILYLFTFLNENKGDCSGELCGCSPAICALVGYQEILV